MADKNVLSVEEFESLEPTEDRNLSNTEVFSVDEFERLGSVEDTIRNNGPGNEFEKQVHATMSRGDRGFFENIKESFKRGNESSNIDIMSYSALVGQFNYENDVKPIRDEYLKRVSEDPVKGGNFLTNAIYSVSGMIPAMGKGLIEGKAVGATAAIAAGIYGQAGPQALAPEEFFTVPAAYAAGSTAGSFNYWYKQGAGSIFSDLKDQGIENGIAVPVSHIAGALYGAVEFSQVDKLIPGSKQVLKQVVVSSVKKTVANLAKRYGVNWASEITEEGIQEAIISIAEDVSTNIAGQTNATIGQIANKALVKGWGAVKDSAIPMLLLMGPGAAVDSNRAINEANALKQADQILTEAETAPETVQNQENVQPEKAAAETPEASEQAQPDKAEPPTKQLPPEIQDIVDSVAEEEGDIDFDPAKLEAQLSESESNPIVRRLKDRLETIDDEQQKRDIARETLGSIRGFIEEFRNRINVRTNKSFSKERLAEIPNRFKKTKGGIGLDEARDELNESGSAGRYFENEDEVIDYLVELDKSEKNVSAVVRSLAPKYYTKKETTILNQRIRDIQAGIKSGKSLAKEEIKTVQTELNDLVQQSDLDAADKNKFSTTLKNTQTQAQLEKVLPKIEQKIGKLKEKAVGRIIRKQVDKLLASASRKKKALAGVKGGKFDYETNKFVQSLRSIAALTKEEALAAIEGLGEAQTELDLIERRFLSYKALGAEASVDLQKAVLEDMRNIIETGIAAKSSEDFLAKLERKDRVDELNKAMEKRKGSKDSFSNKALNFYRKGFSNVYSLLNSIAGKSIAEKYDPELAENRRNDAILFKTKEAVQQLAEIYGIKENEAKKKLEDMAREKYVLFDKNDTKVIHEINKLDLIDIYNSVKNEKISERYDNHYGEEQINDLLGNLTGQDVAFADYLQEQVQAYYDILNQRNIELRGLDLGVVENYWPSTSETPVDVFDDVKFQGETPSAMKERAAGNVIPRPASAWLKFHRHVAQAEHVQHLSREYETLKRLFNQRSVKSIMERKFGKDIHELTNDLIDNISLNKLDAKVSWVSKLLGTGVNNWVVSKIALNPSVYVKQLISVGNYMEVMDSGEWVKYFGEGVSNPKETFKWVWDNVPFIRARYERGYSEAIERAISAAEEMGKSNEDWTKALTAMVRSGDITAIIYGGYPVLKSELAKHGDMQKAIDAYEKATLKAQQSGLSSSLSQFQNDKNPLTRFFLAFKNTPTQYMRKIVDAMIQYHDGDIDSNQLAKTMIIYAGIQPALYGAAGVVLRHALYGDSDDEDGLLEDIFNGIMEAILLNPINAIPIIEDAAAAGLRLAKGKDVFTTFSTPLFDDLNRAARKLQKKNPSAFEYLSSFSTFTEPFVASPAVTYLRILEKQIERFGG